jgi:hypothetical protein
MRGLLTAVVANAVLALRAFAFGYAARVVERTPARVPPLAYMPQRSRHVSLAWDAVRCAVLVQAELGIPAPGGVRRRHLVVQGVRRALVDSRRRPDSNRGPLYYE